MIQREPSRLEKHLLDALGRAATDRHIIAAAQGVQLASFSGA
jgi:hypothetical protein